MLMIHGQRDSYIREELAQQLYDSVPGPKQLWIVPTAKHNQAVATEPEEFARRTSGFFLRHLAGVESGVDVAVAVDEDGRQESPELLS